MYLRLSMVWVCKRRDSLQVEWPSLLTVETAELRSVYCFHTVYEIATVCCFHGRVGCCRSHGHVNERGVAVDLRPLDRDRHGPCRTGARHTFTRSRRPDETGIRTLTRTLAERQEEAARQLVSPVEYTIRTEAKNMRLLTGLVGQTFGEGGTLRMTGVGLWAGTSEPALELVIVASAGAVGKVRAFCETIKVLNRQSAVLLTWRPVTREEI